MNEKDLKKLKADIEELEEKLNGMVSQEDYEPDGDLSIDEWIDAMDEAVNHSMEVQTGRSQMVQAVGALRRAKAALVGIEDAENAKEMEGMCSAAINSAIRGWKYYALALKQQAHSGKKDRLRDRQRCVGRPKKDKEEQRKDDIRLAEKVNEIRGEAKASGARLGIAQAGVRAGYGDRSDTWIKDHFKLGQKEIEKLRSQKS